MTADWPPPDGISLACGAVYVKESQSALPGPAEHVMRGAQYRVAGPEEAES
jgi:hypothetical protein